MNLTRLLDSAINLAGRDRPADRPRLESPGNQALASLLLRAD